MSNEQYRIIKEDISNLKSYQLKILLGLFLPLAILFVGAIVKLELKTAKIESNFRLLESDVKNVKSDLYDMHQKLGWKNEVMEVTRDFLKEYHSDDIHFVDVMEDLSRIENRIENNLKPMPTYRGHIKKRDE